MALSKENFYLNIMNVPSLNDLSMMNIAIKVWKAPDLQDVIEQHVTNHGSWMEHSHELYKKVLEKLACVTLPDTSKERAENILFSIGRDVLNWIHDGLYPRRTTGSHDRHFTRQQRIQHLDSLCFTFNGSIDTPNTLSIFLDRCPIHSKEFLNQSFEFACKHCNENLIRKLWDILLPNTKAKLRKVSSHHTKIMFVKYWSCLLNDNRHKFIDIMSKELKNYNPDHDLYENMLLLFEHKHNMNLNALQYVWKKYEEICSDPIKRAEKAVEMLANNEHFQETIDSGFSEIQDCAFFLLSQIKNFEKQVETRYFRIETGLMLSELYRNWNMQKYLLQIFDSVQDNIDENDYESFIFNIVDDIKCLTSKYLISIFRDIWSISSPRLKEYLFEHSKLPHLILSFISAEDIYIPCLILSCTNDELKEGIFEEIVTNEELLKFIRENKLQLVEEFLKENSVSILDRVKYMKTAAKRIAETLVKTHFDKEDKWNVYQKLLNWSCSYENEIRINEGLDKVNIVDSVLNVDEYRLLEKFLNRKCCSKELRKILKDKININHIFRYLIKGLDYKVLDSIIRWYCQSVDEAKKMKVNLAKEQCLYITKTFSLEYDWERFKKFISWCFESEKEIKKFRALISEKKLIYESCLKELHSKHCLEFTGKLLFWCLDSDANLVARFKSDFILSDLGFRLFETALKDQLLEPLAKWLNPLEKTAVKTLKAKVERRQRSLCSCVFCCPIDVEKIFTSLE